MRGYSSVFSQVSRGQDIGPVLDVAVGAVRSSPQPDTMIGTGRPEAQSCVPSLRRAGRYGIGVHDRGESGVGGSSREASGQVRLA